MPATRAKSKSKAAPKRRFIGVYRTQSGRDWYAAVVVDGVSRFLGRFDDPAEAALFHDRAAVFHRKNRRPLNFPEHEIDPASVAELHREYTLRFGRSPNADRRVRRSKYRGVRPTPNGKFVAMVDAPSRRRLMVGLWSTEHKAAMAHDRAVLHFGRSAELNFPKRSRALGPASPERLRLEARRSARLGRDACAFIGVHRAKEKAGGWTAVLHVRGVTHTIGRFETPKQAALWRERAAAYYRAPETEVLRNFPELRVRRASLAQLRREYLEWRKGARAKLRHESTAHMGVHARKGGFSSAVKVNGRILHLGWWRTERDAAIARDRAVLHFGVPSKLNFPKLSRALGSASPAELRILAQSKSRGSRGECPFVGVSKLKAGGWEAHLSKGRKIHDLGRFETAKDAALWRERAVVHYGESGYSLRNFPKLKVVPASVAELRREYRKRRKQQTSSRYIGVTRLGYSNATRPWAASYGHLTLGTWETEEEAAEACDRARLHYEGQTAELNLPERAHELVPADAETLWHETRAGFKAQTWSQYRGVYWSSSRSVWISRIQFQRRLHKLGRFQGEVDAARAYDRKALKLLGDRARLNFHPDTGEEIGGRMLEPQRPRRPSKVLRKIQATRDA